ncbi:MAG: L-seryl-tRNA(Sec) selenium transferase [Thermodesulfobacteriota bacterium]
MKPTDIQRKQLQSLPGVDRILLLAREMPGMDAVPKSVLVGSIRKVIDGLRQAVLRETGQVPDEGAILAAVGRQVEREMTPNLKPVVNATGVVVHTNLGRSLLAAEAVAAITRIAATYSNLEFDLTSGRRGLRYSLVEDLIREISGAEAAMAVNNNAGAVLLCLDTLARGKAVVVSRGELVEIGGSFRIPDVMARSGAVLKEVGTTNRTHPRDYEQAISSETALLLKVHTSNFSVVGFTASVSLPDLVQLAGRYGLPVMEDLGSGTFMDFSAFGLMKEPTVQESVAAGADVVTFSGDKLLGGPQAGIIVGRKSILDEIKKNPLTRALRIDKLTLAALEATLRLYRDPATMVEKIPTLRMLLTPLAVIEKRADILIRLLEAIADDRIAVCRKYLSSKTGGGALPLMELPSCCVGLTVGTMTAAAIEKRLRSAAVPVIGRIEDDLFLMDARTIQDGELEIIRDAVVELIQTR